MRGKIIQYNGADGSGTIVAGGKQYRFALSAWRGNTAPAVNKSVDIELEEDAITTVTLIGEDVLLKEKAAQWSGKLGAAMKKMPRASAPASNDPAAHHGAGAEALMSSLDDIPVTGKILRRYGIAIPIAWLLFVIGTLAFATVSISMSGFSEHHELSKSMFGIGAGGGAGGFFVRFLLIAGYLSIFVPMLWRNRRAWLTLLLPLVAVLWSWIYASRLLGEAHSKYDALVNKFQGMAAFTGDPISLYIGHGFGFWLALIMAIIIAALALMRYLEIDMPRTTQPA